MIFFGDQSAKLPKKTNGGENFTISPRHELIYSIVLQSVGQC
jgi:hypothetical protein